MNRKFRIVNLQSIHVKECLIELFRRKEDILAIILEATQPRIECGIFEMIIFTSY